MEKIKNTKDEILESLFLKQTKIVNFEEFEAEINYILYQYQHYLFELKAQVLKSSRRNKIIDYLKKIEQNYSQLLNFYNINWKIDTNNKISILINYFKWVFYKTLN